MPAPLTLSLIRLCLLRTRTLSRPLAHRPHACMQVSPDAFVLVAGALTELLVSFRPVTSGAKDVKVCPAVLLACCSSRL